MILKIILIILGCLIVLFISVVGYLIAPKKPNKNNSFRLDQIKFAHRGIHDNSTNIPENSMRAFKKTLDLGYAIELDIRETKDKEIVVFHDDSLKRMCNIDCLVNELTLKELKGLNLLNTDQVIPTFKEVLNLVQGKVPLLVEFKAALPGDKCIDICVKANNVLKDYQGDYAIESFNYSVLAWYKKNHPEILRGQLGMGMQCYDVALGKTEAKKMSLKKRRMVTYLFCNFIGRPNFIGYRWQDINLIVKLNKLLGAKIICWTVITVEDSQRLLKDYDGVIFEKYLA